MLLRRGRNKAKSAPALWGISIPRFAFRMRGRAASAPAIALLSARREKAKSITFTKSFKRNILLFLPRPLRYSLSCAPKSLRPPGLRSAFFSCGTISPLLLVHLNNPQWTLLPASQFSSRRTLAVRRITRRRLGRKMRVFSRRAEGVCWTSPVR